MAFMLGRCYFTCAMATARFRRKTGGTAYVLGETGLTTALHHNGFAIVDKEPDYVVVGEGARIRSRCSSMQPTSCWGVRSLSPPIWTQVARRLQGPGRLRAVVKLIEEATGRQAFSVGKLADHMRATGKELGLDADQAFMVGDTMSTDVLGGVQLGYHTILVLSGGTRRDDLTASPTSPIPSSSLSLTSIPIVSNGFFSVRARPPGRCPQ